MAGSKPRERTALIVTVLDEAGTIDALLESVAAQTLKPDEVVVVDGGSHDGTWQRLQTWTPRLPLRLIQATGAGIARGRNLAIAATTSARIAVTDAGVRLDPHWFERLHTALTDEVEVVAGFFKADPSTTFERALGATVLPTLSDVEPDRFLPSSRSVLFRREAWAAVGGYPEWLDFGEDLVFDFALKDAGYRFAFAATALVWFRPRSSLAAFFRQYYRYARGDGKADLWCWRHALRYATYALTTAIIVLSSGVSPRSAARPRLAAGLLLVLLGGTAYTWRPYARLGPCLGGLPRGEVAYALALVPLIRLVGDVAKMLGYPVGVWWRLSGQRVRVEGPGEGESSPQ
ncbi:MAG: glycosyltransferase [Chloroflexi bacterium]|nr:glycosyltransferase [Chloroflexota bacterium]